MSDDGLKRRAIALYDRYTHHGLDRRDLLAELGVLAGGTLAANALLAAIAADPAAAAIVAPGDKRLLTGDIALPTSDGGNWQAYFAEPRQAGRKRGTLIVVHENRGLNEHIRDVTRRFAVAGFYAVAPDFLSRGGARTPADEDAARTAIGALDLPRAIADASSAVDRLRTRKGGNGKVGITGFCWGGAMANRVAVASGARLAASVPWYGPAPPPGEAAKVKAAMLLHYAENDSRVNVTAQPWIDALKAAKVPAEAFFYEGTEHAFHNDTSAARYDAMAAALAWERTLAFFRKHLA